MKKLEPEAIISFLARTPPFSLLDHHRLVQLALACGQEYHPKGAVILKRGRSPVEELRIIYEGRIKVFLKDEKGEETLRELRGPGQTVGQLALLRGSFSNLDVTAEEDSTCLVLAKNDFLSLVQRDLPVALYYLKDLSEGYVSRALTRLEQPHPTVGLEGSLYLFSLQVGDAVRRRPAVIGANETIRQAAVRMEEERVGSLLVTAPSGEIIGIVTDRDFRKKVVALGLGVDEPVERIMSSPVRRISSHAVCFDALLEMMREHVHHLALENRGEIVGVISGHDLMVIQGSSPLRLVREIREARKIEQLFDPSLRSPRLVRALLNEGARPGNITRMITLVNDYILERLLTLLIAELGPPPVPFCWLLMGSEGRREQTFRTDQDNGLLYQDPESDAQARQARDYFTMLAEETVKALGSCGFPLCKGGIMASNPKWRQPYSVWKSYFDQWIQAPTPREVLHATIFFDFRPGWGDPALGQRLREHLMRALSGREVFFRHLAQDCLTSASPLSFLRQLTVEKTGEYKGRLDIKTKGLTPLVDFARLMSLKAGIPETNTLERLQLLGEAGAISQEMRQRAVQAFEFMMQIRLIHQRAQEEEAAEPDNYIDPRKLTELDRGALKESFGVIQDIKEFLKEAFQLASV